METGRNGERDKKTEIKKTYMRKKTQELTSEGKKFGKYILEKKLGSGGMGTVFKAYHTKLESYFALKIVLSERLGEEGMQRFEREARVSSKLKHPNIVHVYDVGVQSGKHYIVMDYIEGRTLTDMIEQSRFWPRKAFEIVIQLAKALQYSHDQGIIHRDIKPPNIMIVEKDGKDIPYLMDFGIASVVKEDGLTREGQIMGTPQYMSPEQARDSKGLDAKSDIYSLGAVLYEMLSGKPAVESNQAMMVLYDVLHKDPPLLSTIVPGIAKDAEAITMKCLEKSTYRRYQKADELADDIERYLRGEAVLARSPGYIYRLWRKAMRNLKFTAVIATAIVLVIGVAVLGILRLHEKDRELEKTKEAQARELEKTKEAQAWELKKAREEALKVIRVKIKETWNEAIKQEKDGNFEKASELCQTLIDWDPTDNRFSKKLVEITHKKDTFQKNKESQQREARKYYDRAMEVFWNPRLDEDELNRCKELFERAIKEYPAFADAHFQAGRAAHRLFNTEEAIKHYKNSLYYDPNLTPPKYYMTVLEFPSILQKISIKEGSPDEFNKKFEEIWGYSPETIKISPETSNPYPLLGKTSLLLSLWILTEQKDTKDRYWKECLECCNKVITDHPNFSDAYIIKAQLYSYWIEMYKDEFEVKETLDPIDLDQALKDCSRALYLDPYRKEVYALRGAIYKSIGAYDIAEKDYTRALILKRGTMSDFYRARAVCYLAMKKWELAMIDLKRNKELAKEDADSSETRSQAFLWEALIKSWLKKKDEAEKAMSDYISCRPMYKAQFDGFIKGFFYIFMDDEVKRAEDAFKIFLKTESNILKMGQVFASYVKNKSHNHNIEEFSRFLRSFPNLLCLAPELKQNINDIPDILSSITSISFGGEPTKRGFEFSPIARACMENFNKTGEERYKRVNMIFNQEYPPLTLDVFLSVLDYVGEKKKVETMLNLKELPTASLYYRRAVEFYFKSKLSKENKHINDNSINNERNPLEYAKSDLEAALELEPTYMEAHYGLATVYSLLCACNPEKKATYKDIAIYHLRQAVENGWAHLEDYTLKDDDFKPLELGKEIHLETLRSWDKEREENQRQTKRLEKKVKDIISRGESLQALRLLYEPKLMFSSQLKDLIESTEGLVADYIMKELKEGNDKDLDKKIEHILGDRGKIILEEAKRKKDSR